MGGFSRPHGISTPAPVAVCGPCVTPPPPLPVGARAAMAGPRGMPGGWLSWPRGGWCASCHRPAVERGGLFASDPRSESGRPKCAVRGAVLPPRLRGPPSVPQERRRRFPPTAAVGFHVWRVTSSGGLRTGPPARGGGCRAEASSGKAWVFRQSALYLLSCA